MEAIFAIFPIIFMLIWGVMFLAMIGGLVFWIIMLIDAITRDDDKFPNPGDNTKLMWILILIFTSWIGGLVYYFMVKKKISK